MTDFPEIAAFLIGDREGDALLGAEDRFLAMLGCHLAIAARPERMQGLLSRALAEGVPVSRIEAAFIHAIGYLGVLRAEPGYLVFRAVAAACGQPAAGVSSSIRPTREQRVQIGTALYDRFDPGRAAQQAALIAIVDARYYPRAMELAGIVLEAPELPPRDRQIMTLAMLSCLGGQPGQLRFHLQVALERGVSKEEIGGILIFVQALAGLPRANVAVLLAREVILERDKNRSEKT
jgi:4-carboxymuconolactone decarboxylase